MSETCETSIIMPRRFISAITSRPKAVRPLWCGIAGIVQIAGGVGPVVGVGPGQRHVADAEGVVVAQQGKRVLNGVAALDAHKNGELAGGPRAKDIGRRGAQSEAVGVLANLLQDAFDECAGPLREAPAPGRGFRPDGEELGREVALAGAVQVQHAAGERRGEVPGLVDKALGSVGMAVDHEGGGVDLSGVLRAGGKHRHFLQVVADSV